MYHDGGVVNSPLVTPDGVTGQGVVGQCASGSKLLTQSVMQAAPFTQETPTLDVHRAQAAAGCPLGGGATALRCAHNCPGTALPNFSRLELEILAITPSQLMILPH